MVTLQFSLTFKTLKILAILCLGCCLSHAALAWDSEGHMVTAQLAYNHLDADVRAKCDALIAVNLGTFTSTATSNFVTASSWADDFKSPLGTAVWHYIDLPFSLDGTPTNGVPNPPAAFDVVRAIRQCITTLQDSTQPLTNQAFALRYLIHFVGDIEQPLHSSTGVYYAEPNGDAGGNDFNVGGGWGELHALWDDGGGFLTNSATRPLNDARLATITSKVALVEATYPYPVSIGSIPDPMTWALESWGIATGVCYTGISSNVAPSAAYLTTAQNTTIQRMAIGGQRLAKLLETIYVTNAPPLTSVTLTNGNFGLSWGGVTGRIYRVQSKTDVTNSSWTDMTDITASNTSVLFTEIPALPQKFYRVIVVN